MSNYTTTAFLNLRREPKIQKGNVITVMPPDTVVEKIDGYGNETWFLVKTTTGGVSIKGYASSQYLKQVPFAEPVEETVTEIPAVHYMAGNKKITRNGAGRVYPLTEAGLIKIDLSTIQDKDERCAQIHNVFNFLDVEHSLRYAPGSGNTYCNIYAYDVAYCTGAYLPRVWWTPDAIIKIEKGENIQPVYDKTVTEYTANRIANWFEKYGISFGWQRIFDLTELQEEVNNGQLGIIVGQRINMNNPGHIVAVVPETEMLSATRRNNKVVSPLQSQAGSKNKKYYTNYNWWEDTSRFKKFSYWIWPEV